MPGNSAPSVKDTVNGHVGNASFAVGMAEKIIEGKYTDAAIQGGFRVAFTPQVYEGAAKLTQAVAPVAKGLSWVGKNLPIIGAVVIAAYDAKEVYDHVKKGDYKGAVAAGVAGVAEVAGTAVLGGIGGAAAREAVWGVNHLAGGPDINHSAVVSVGIEAVKLGERAIEKGSKFLHDRHDPAKIAEQQVALLHKDGVLPKTVKLEGKEVGLEVALRNPKFQEAFRKNLEDAQKHGHLDAKPLLAAIDQFDALEKNRVAAVNSSKAPATTVASHKVAVAAHPA